MGIIGFSFTKFDCERKGAKTGKSLQINYNIGLSNVEKAGINVGSAKEDVLKIDFVFDCVYGSDLGKISIKGDVVYTDTKEIIEESLKGWESDKKLNKLVHEHVIKFVYTKAIVKAIELSDALTLPLPTKIPTIDFGKGKKSK